MSDRIGKRVPAAPRRVDRENHDRLARRPTGRRRKGPPHRTDPDRADGPALLPLPSQGRRRMPVHREHPTHQPRNAVPKARHEQRQKSGPSIWTNSSAPTCPSATPSSTTRSSSWTDAPDKRVRRNTGARHQHYLNKTASSPAKPLRNPACPPHMCRSHARRTRRACTLWNMPFDEDHCPHCGGEVRPVLRGGAQLGEANSWNEAGRCEACGRSLRRPLTETKWPSRDMTPSGPWEERNPAQ